MLLAGDVGGTKTRLGIFSPDGDPSLPLAEAVFENARYPDLEAIVREFIDGLKMSVERASFGVAGPVVAGRRTRITNRCWMIDEERLRCALNGAPVILINDLAATACAVPSLAPGDLHILNKGKLHREGNIGVIAPGTGLGEAMLLWDGRRYREHASEGGHVDFGPNSVQEGELLRFLAEIYGHVSYDRVCSGLGIPDMYRFLRDVDHEEEPRWLNEELAGADDAVPIIVRAALDERRPCRLAVKTLSLFLAILGAEAGNLALKVMATGGIYLAGGILPRILPFLERGDFLDAFRRKGRMADLVGSMPVYVILNPRVALLGAARKGLEFWCMPQ
jgi:glucokinase